MFEDVCRTVAGVGAMTDAGAVARLAAGGHGLMAGDAPVAAILDRCEAWDAK